MSDSELLDAALALVSQDDIGEIEGVANSLRRAYNDATEQGEATDMAWRAAMHADNEAKAKMAAFVHERSSTLANSQHIGFHQARQWVARAVRIRRLQIMKEGVPS